MSTEEAQKGTCVQGRDVEITSNQDEDSTNNSNSKHVHHLVVHRPSLVHQQIMHPRLQASRYLSDYRQEECLGKGGFGVVFRVYHSLSDKEFAVKKIHIRTKNKDEVDTMLREVRTLAKIEPHQNVIRYYNSWLEPVHKSSPTSRAKVQLFGSNSGTDLSERTASSASSLASPSTRLTSPDSVQRSHLSFDWSEDNDEKDDEDQDFEWERASSDKSGALVTQEALMQPELVLFMQMELCLSSTLEEWLLHRTVVNTSISNRILMQVISALEWIHRHSIVHRDLKPSNLFISHDCTIKLGDFGLARDISDDAPEGTQIEFRKDKSQEKIHLHTRGVGTQIYASPEQLEGERCTDRTDIFSFGVVLVEIYHIFDTRMERIVTLGNARSGDLPAKFLSENVHIGEVARDCLKQAASERPCATEVRAHLSNSLNHVTRRDLVVDLTDHVSNHVTNRVISISEPNTPKCVPAAFEFDIQGEANMCACDGGEVTGCGGGAEKKCVLCLYKGKIKELEQRVAELEASNSNLKKLVSKGADVFASMFCLPKGVQGGIKIPIHRENNKDNSPRTCTTDASIFDNWNDVLNDESKQ